MPNYVDYFNKVTYKPKYHLGDRVRGKYGEIPFAGTVAIDNMIDTDEGPYIIVHLDLPINVGTAFINMIKVKHKDLIDIKGSYESSSKTNRKKSAMGSNRRTTKSRER